MIKDKILKVKEGLEEKGNNKRKIENLVVFVVIMIVTVVIVNYVWNGNKKRENTIDDEISTKTKVLAETGKQDLSKDELATRLEDILSGIKGVGKIKVLITYSKSSQIVPMYSEDASEKVTEETDSGGGKRTVTENTTKKDLAYEDSNGTKKILTQSTVSPTVEGAIITAEGASDTNVKANIIQAIEAATGLATYKIQVFEMQ